MFLLYFNYIGMLAVEGVYNKMEALLNQNIHPIDILLLMVVSEGVRVTNRRLKSYYEPVLNMM